MNKRILIITPTVNPSSGWGRVSIEILNRYKKAGLQFGVCTNDREEISFKKEVILEDRSVRGVILNSMRVREVAKKYDVIHVFDQRDFSLYAFFAVLGTPKKLFILGHGTYSVSPLDKPLLGVLFRLIYLRAEAIFCNSSFTAGEIKKRVPKANTPVVPLGTSNLVRPSREDAHRIRDIISKRGPVVITVGAIKKRKGQIYTLQALKKLKKDFPNILYVMLGDDTDKFYVEKIKTLTREHALEDNVLIRGRVTDGELSGWYEVADIFALNSVNHDGHFEGFGLVILEGYQAGLPAVGSRGCGIEDAIRDGETGYLTNQKDFDDIAEKIKKILDLGKENLSDKCRAFGKKFSWERTANTYLAYLK